MSTNIGKFKDTMKSMFDELERWIPADSELETQKIMIEGALKVNPRATIGEYMSSIKEYARPIMEGDDSYFLANASTLVDTEYSGLSKKLQTLWLTLDSKQQNILKRYCKLLFILGTIVTQDEEMRLLINEYRDKTNPLVF